MRLLREPLLHFLVAGVLLFAADAALQDDVASSERVIRITAAEVDRLRTQWTRQYRRAPTPTDIRGLIDARVREEVFYREALAMGLDQDDGIVRRRLAQKLEFLIEDLAATRAPTDAELGAFFEARPERYRLPGSVTFSQIYFSADRRGRAAQADARLVLAGLGPETLPAAAADRGDRFMTGESYREQSSEDVAALFGRAFADALFTIEPGRWAGPIASSHGWHLVRIEARSDSRLPTLAEVADRVRQDWAYEQRRQANDAVFEQLAARYELIIEDGGRGRPASANTEERP